MAASAIHSSRNDEFSAPLRLCVGVSRGATISPMKLSAIAVIFASFALAPALVAQRGAAPKVANPVVVQFMVDGIDHNSVRTAIAAGATTLGSLLKQGVTAETYYCT